jgi:hypothetical protein
MTTPIPQRVDDPKDAVLWAILNKLETIDENAGSRIAFATGIFYNAQFMLDKELFDNELEQIRGLLKIQKPVNVPDNEIPEASRNFKAVETDVTMRTDDL